MSKKTYKKKCRYKYTKQESLDLDLANTRPGYFGRSTKHIDHIYSYSEGSNNSNVIETRWDGHECRKDIELERGAPPFCSEHNQEDVINEWKNQKKLKRQFNAQEKNRIKKNEQKINILNSIDGNVLFYIMIFAPIIIVFTMVSFMDTTYSAETSRIAYSYDYQNSELQRELKSTGYETRDRAYPNLFRFLFAIWLCIPIYNVIFSIGSSDSWFKTITSSLMYLFFGFLILWIVYGFMVLLLGAMAL